MEGPALALPLIAAAIPLIDRCFHGRLLFGFAAHGIVGSANV